MLQEINRYYEDIKNASKLGLDLKINLKNYENILFCGIGGSGVIGEIIKSLNLSIPVHTTRENLPKWVNSKTLCFVVSYSGNTKETINLFKQAKKSNCKTISITSGGKLKELNKNNTVLVQKGYLPREALIYLLIPILNMLKINYKECYQIVKKFDRKKPLKIAEKLKDKIPIIYSGSENLRYIAYRWQCNFNENTKIFAHSNYFPELAHNEIEAKLNSNFKTIILLDKETKQIKNSYKFLKPIKVKLKGKSQIAKIIYGMYFGDLVSYFLAENKRIDYSKTYRIKELKK